MAPRRQQSSTAPGQAAPLALGRASIDLIVRVNPDDPIPLHRQVYAALRTAILDRTLRPGARLPSTRVLASMAGVARNTVHGAYDQLLAEGYLEARHGSGTYVAASLPDDAVAPTTAPPLGIVSPPAPTPSPAAPAAPSEPSGLSSWGRRVAVIAPTPYLGASTPTLPLDFRHGRPDAIHFPLAEWRRMTLRQLRQIDRGDLWYGPPAGSPALREALAGYLRRARGLRCTAGQIIVTTGTQQAIDLIARLLVEAGDAVVVEDPCYPGARRVFQALGARLVDVPVDEHGLRTDLLPDEPARILYATPSHQYPSGATLPLSRRLDLLLWAARHEVLVVEDDYDSEFRHSGRPLEALQGLDTGGRVAYVGSFSKVLYPALRLGYLVVPPALAGLAAEAKRLLDLQTATPGQELLADMIQSGQFEAHLRRMRRVYRARRDALLMALASELGPLATPGPNDAGLYLRVVLADGLDEVSVARRAAALGVAVYPAGPYYARPVARPGLILGYAALDEAGIREGIRRLRLAIDAERAEH